MEEKASKIARLVTLSKSVNVLRITIAKIFLHTYMYLCMYVKCRYTLPNSIC